jgi:hypothetical protein
VLVQSHNGNQNEEPAPAPAARSSRWANVALLLISVLAPLLALEIGYRLMAGLPLLKLANWRTDHVMMVNLGELKAIPDPVLGWTNKSSSYNKDGYTTLEHGVRKNFDETALRTGGMLAAGDSFTEGWEVKDHESWPAAVEKLTSVPVVNAGTGGYGTDQTILRAEQMLPIVKPKILLLGFHEIAITRAGHTAFGALKPYFTFDNGELRYHPATFIQPREKNTIAWRTAYGIREALGYSAFADYLLSRLNPNFWHGDPDRDLYQRSGVDEVDITCALLERLKTRADQDGVHMMLFLQYYATRILESDRPGPYSQAVAECARYIGIRVVDQFASLHSIVAAGGPAIIRDYYFFNNGIFGHMTAKGNEHAANLIEPALRDWLPVISDAPSRTGSIPQGETPQP